MASFTVGPTKNEDHAVYDYDDDDNDDDNHDDGKDVDALIIFIHTFLRDDANAVRIHTVSDAMARNPYVWCGF